MSKKTKAVIILLILLIISTLAAAGYFCGDYIMELFDEKITDVKIKKVTADNNTRLLLTTDGDLFGYGLNDSFKLLQDDTSMIQAKPKKLAVKEKIKDVSLGKNHVLALTNDGKVLSWGNDGYDNRNEKKDKVILESTIRNIMPDKKFRYVKAGDDNSFIIDENGYLYVWGKNEHGELGTGKLKQETEPVLVTDKLKFKCVKSAYDKTIAISESGDLYVWGLGKYLGTGKKESGEMLPVRIDMDDIKFDDVEIGENFALALSNGKLYAWGVNDECCLGDYFKNEALKPVEVLKDIKIREISASGSHVVLINSEGKIFTYGSNELGQLGIKPIGTSIAKPYQHESDEKFVSIETTDNYNFAVDSNGITWLFGDYNYMLADNNVSNEVLPVTLIKLTDLLDKKFVLDSNKIITVDEKKYEKEVWHTAYMSGFKDNTFKPDMPITRAEVATILAKMSDDYDENKKYFINFIDVPETAWYRNFIGFCVEKKYMSGVTSETFVPSDNIKRVEFIATIVRFADIPYKDEKSKYLDVQGKWFESYVGAAEKKGLNLSDTDNFGVNDLCTRGEVCYIINKLLELEPDKKAIDKVKIKNQFTDVTKENKYYYDIIEATNTHKYKEFHSGDMAKPKNTEKNDKNTEDSKVRDQKNESSSDVKAKVTVENNKTE